MSVTGNHASNGNHLLNTHWRVVYSIHSYTVIWCQITSNNVIDLSAFFSKKSAGKMLKIQSLQAVFIEGEMQLINAEKPSDKIAMDVGEKVTIDTVSNDTVSNLSSLSLALSNHCRQSTALLVIETDDCGQEINLPVTEERPWGSYTVIADEPNYKLKQLLVKPDSRLSLQRHFKREEHWIILSGEADITLGNTCELYKAGSYIFIPLKSWHRIANSQKENVILVEVQCGSYFGEDDIERSQDDYGRA